MVARIYSRTIIQQEASTNNGEKKQSEKRTRFIGGTFLL